MRKICRKFFCRTVPKKIVDEYFNDSMISGIENFMP